MRKLGTGLAFILASLLLFGCATPKPNMLHSEAIAGEVAPEPGRALVVFLRPDESGFNFHASVHDGDKLIGLIPYNQKLPYQATPGRHTFMAVSEAADFMTADLVAGRTYYVQVVPRMGWVRPRYSLVPITRDDLKKDEVKAWIKDGRWIRNKPSAFEWEERTLASILTKKQKYYPLWLAKDEGERPHLAPDDGI